MWTMFSSLPGWSADHTQARPELSHSRSPPGEPGVYPKCELGIQDESYNNRVNHQSGQKQLVIHNR